MKRKSTYRYGIFLLALLMLSLRQAPADRITGKWLLVSYTAGGETAKPYQLLELTEKGEMKFRGFTIAYWKLEGEKIILRSGQDETMNGTGRLIWNAPGSMTWKWDKGEMTFLRWSDKYVPHAFEGVWVYYDDPEVYISFGSGTQFTEFVVNDYGTERSSGDAFYFPDEKKLVIHNPAGFFNGVYRLKKNDERQWVLSQNASGYTILYDGEEAPEPPLHFSMDQIPAREDENRLPWDVLPPDAYDTATVYHYLRSSYIDELKRFYYVNETDRHAFDMRNRNFCITRYRIKPGKQDRIDRKCKGYVAESHNPFFPMPRPDRFRIVSTDTLYETPDFALNCTLVEGVEGEKKFRYWMVNDMPGVYARIIVQFPGDRDQEVYYIRELIEITKTDSKQ